MKFLEFINELKCVIPEEIQEEWDNSGVQINTGNREIEKVLVTLEITDSVIEEAIEKNVDMIVTHHPLIFSGIKSIETDEAIGSYIYDLIKNDISVYSCHTNFDRLDGGNNDKLCDILNLYDVDFLPGEDITRLGMCEEKTLRQVAEDLADGLDIDKDEIRIVGDEDKLINRIGLCSGAGSEYIPLAALSGCDLYITGDLKYHEARTAEELGISVIDAGHYGTEKIFPDAFIALMEENDFTDDLEFIEAETCNCPLNKLK